MVDSTTLYKQLVSDIRVGTNGYVMIKNANDMVVMHPEPAQWGIQVVDGRQKLYAYKELDLTSLSELLKAQRTPGLRYPGLLLLLVDRPQTAPGA